MAASFDSVVVWGNCQAAPLAALLRGSLAEHGLRVADVAPVFLADTTEMTRVQELVAGSALLISQPIGAEYPLPGSDTADLAARLPANGRLLTIPVLFHLAPYPCQVTARGADGARVDAPLTDYHDLRMILAASRQASVADTVATWPAPAPGAVRAISAASTAELRRRDTGLDVAAGDLLDAPDRLWTISHPANAALAALATAILAALGWSAEVAAPRREFLGDRRAPLERTVIDAHGWGANIRTDWQIAGRQTPLAEIAATQLEFYRSRRDVIEDCLSRYAERLTTLGFETPSISGGMSPR